MADPWDIDWKAQGAPSAAPAPAEEPWNVDWNAHQVPTDMGGIAADISKSAGIGLAKGGIGMAGLPGDAANLLAKGSQIASDYLAQKLGFEKGPEPTGPLLPTSSGIQKGIEGVTGEFYKPQTTAGEYAQTMGEFVPAAIGGQGAAIPRFLERVAIPAAASETAGQATKGTDYEPYARIAGGIMAPAVSGIARRVITPFPGNPERAQFVDTLTNEGVDLTAGQRTGNRPLQWAETTLGDMPLAGGRPAEMMTRQQEQFTAAALRRAGEDANRATPEVVDNAFHRIGNQFETIGARNYVAPDQQFVTDLLQTRDEYHNLVGPHSRAPVVDNTINDIAAQMQRNGGYLNGDQYNAMSSRLARQARNARMDPQLQDTLQGLRNNLDDAFERTLQRGGNTADLDALQEARRQYRNLLVIEKASTGAGSATAEGLLSPSQLKGAVVQQNRRAYARGQGDFADLARAGEAVMRPLPNSGTAPRQNLQHLLSLAGVAAGGAAGGAEGGLAGAAAGMFGPALAGRAVMSRLGQAYLGNQVLPQAAAATPAGALARVIVAGQAGALPQRLYVSPYRGVPATQSDQQGQGSPRP